VRAVEFVGPAQRVRVDLPDGTRVTARVAARPRWWQGDTAALHVPDPVHVIDEPSAVPCAEPVAR
jgi:hypothetical protein